MVLNCVLAFTLPARRGKNHGGFARDVTAPVVVGAGAHLEGEAAAVVEEIDKPEPGAVMADAALLMMKSIKIVDQPSDDEGDQGAAGEIAELLPPSSLPAGQFANGAGAGEHLVVGEDGDAASDGVIEEEVIE